MNSEEQPSAPRVNAAVRWFVVGLPLGLLLMGLFSFVIYFQKRHAQEAAAAAPSRYAPMLRKDLNIDDYLRYVRIFEQEIGPRTPEKPDNIEAAQSFIESSLGFGNMGYQVVRREMEIDGKITVDLEVELPGRDHASPVHLVTSRYDGASAKDIAALLCLANAFTGTTHRDSVRFVAWSGRAGGEEKFHLERYRQWLPFGGAKSDTMELEQFHSKMENAMERLRKIEEEIRMLAGDKPARE